MNMAIQTGIMPPAEPITIAETGLSPLMMRDIILKTMFRANLSHISDISQAICLPLAVTTLVIESMRNQRLIEVISMAASATNGEISYQLTDAGRARALDALAQSEYFGAMPVPLASYSAQVLRQSVRRIKTSRADLQAALAHLILPKDFIDTLGPAVSAGRAILLYGPSGNGKSSIANAIHAALGGLIYVPRAVEYRGQVIPVFDPIFHIPASEGVADAVSLRRTGRVFDPRYVLCQRPAIVIGGELTLDMLDLKYAPASRTYQAPLQLKASGGIFVVDDLGKQAETPQKLVNRWIGPLEEGRDTLQLYSGEKFTVPFDALVMFSTNAHPNDIFDTAALRRIFAKIRVDGPNQEMFLNIFGMVARKRAMAINEVSILHLLRTKYPTINNAFANYQPAFLIDQMAAICDFEGLPYQMTPDLVDRAWANMVLTKDMGRA